MKLILPQEAINMALTAITFTIDDLQHSINTGQHNLATKGVILCEINRYETARDMIQAAPILVDFDPWAATFSHHFDKETAKHIYQSITGIRPT